MTTLRVPIPRELREQVFARDGRVCRYCGATDNLTIDHVHPVARGGATEINNLVVACRTCNSSKHAAVGRVPKPPAWQRREAELLARIAALEMQVAGSAFRQPDPAIDLAFVRLPVNRGLYLFVAASDQRPARLVTWTCIPRSPVIVASDAGAALAMLMERYSNESLEVLLDGIHSAIIAEIRLYYGVQISRRRRPARQLSLELPPEGD